MKKVVFFAFKGEEMCFMHLLLNALDLNEKGIEAKIVMEGEAVKLIQVLEESNNKLYQKAKDLNLFDSICKACSAKMGVLEYNQTCGIPMNGELQGHPPMVDYIKAGFEIITL